MPADPARVQAAFLAAADLPDPAARAAALDRECGGDAELRARVEALLTAHADPDSLLDLPLVTPPGGDVTSVHPPGDADVTRTQAPADPDATADPRVGHADAAEALAFLKPSARPGSLGRLDHYEVLEVVGSGGFGTVMKAFDTRLHRVVAVKVLAPQLAASGAARARFLREARTAAAVKDEHVVNVFAVSDDDAPVPYLVMEFVAGQTLQQKLGKVGPLPAKEVLRVGTQVARGLAAAHAQGLIHRDIKPANVLLENGVERVKITDFGLARAADDASLSQSGVVAGTPMYMSPEQARGDTLDTRSDLFSLGSVLYVLCTGRPPFRAETTFAVLKRVIEDDPRPVRDVNPEVPRWLADVVGKLHAKDPADRFQTAQEVADLLAGYLAELQQQGTVLSRVAAPPAARKRRRKWVAATALLFGLGVPLAIWAGWVTGYFPRRQADATGMPPERRSSSAITWGTVEDPLGDCHFVEEDGRLSITVPGGEKHDLNPRMWGSGMSGPRVLREVDGDFEARVTVLCPAGSDPSMTSSPDAIPYIAAGLLVMQDSTHLLRNCRSRLRAFPPSVHAHWFNGDADTGERMSPPQDGPIHLRIRRVGGVIFIASSTDGQDWADECATDFPSAGRVRVGVVVVSTVNQDYTAQFEGFTLRGLPPGPNAPAPGILGGLVPLFNGKDLTGWKTHPEQLGNWKVEGGVLVGRGPKLSHLFSDRGDYRDFHLRTEVRVNDSGNSGVHFRATLPPAAVQGAPPGYEVQVAGPSADRNATGTLMVFPAQDYVLAKVATPPVPADTWFTLEVIARGRRVVVRVDGREVVNREHTGPQVGHLALQAFPATRVEFRKIEIAERLPPPPAVAPFSPEQAKAHQEAWARHLGVSVAEDGPLGMTLVLVPPGEFRMGSGSDEVGSLVAEVRRAGGHDVWVQQIPAEAPPAAVRLTRPWWLADKEVTRAQFRAFVEATGYRTDAERARGDRPEPADDRRDWFHDKTRNWRKPGPWVPEDGHPILSVSWNDAAAFCEWLGEKTGRPCRLPTEAEWEFAARAGNDARYDFAADAGRQAEFAVFLRPGPAPTGRTKANPFGLFDMLGNAWEWCGGRYARGHGPGMLTDPCGPEGSQLHAIRGGGWPSPGYMARPAARWGYPPDHRDPGIGFRVAFDLARPVSPTPPPAVAPFSPEQAKAHQEAWAKHLGLPVEFAHPSGVAFRLIPPGEFGMGFTDAELAAVREELKTTPNVGDYQRFAADSSGPRHTVRITRPFYLAKYETTAGQFQRFLDATKHTPTGTIDWKSLITPGQEDKQPVWGVSWDDAAAFGRWLGAGYGLPTEAQWEYAARAGSAGLWSFGDDPGKLIDHAVVAQAGGKPGPVGLKRANPFGLFDVHGGADEWCRDWHLRDFYRRSPVDDPECGDDPADPGSGRVSRGGSWNAAAVYSKAAFRAYDNPTRPTFPKGFRVALTGDLKAAVAAARAPTEPGAPWLPLFNGRDLAGWVERAEPGQPPGRAWEVREDGVLTSRGLPRGFLRTEKSYRHYVFEADIEPTAKLTDGRGPWAGDLKFGFPDLGDGRDQLFPGLLVQVVPGGDGTVTFAGTGEKVAWPAFRPGWNRLRVESGPDGVSGFLNGEPVFTRRGPDAGVGYIGLGSAGSGLRFRDVRLRPGPAK